jgi:hypothetical protein
MKPKHFQPIGRNTCLTCPWHDNLVECTKHNFTIKNPHRRFCLDHPDSGVKYYHEEMQT